ncbi:unnamed protein product [Prunus armeniaca]|uniref:Uncharacterized protein n=1 Tax=Prunus armeniaca TaxID=36596 RepID=A0A6J5V5S5_PRUAR|nr:unnamed protein product [Prunus armeniaca]
MRGKLLTALQLQGSLMYLSDRIIRKKAKRRQWLRTRRNAVDPTRTPTTKPITPFKSLLKPDPLIPQTLDDLRSANASSSSSSKTITLADLAVGSTCREVSDLDLPCIPSKIELQMLKVIKSILDGNGFAFEVPSRAAANQLYVPELDRIMLKDKTSLRRPQGHHHSSSSPADPPALPQFNFF